MSLLTDPSMKVPPKRKGNPAVAFESALQVYPSMKVPPKRKGNGIQPRGEQPRVLPSMKVPPKRKGNLTNGKYQKFMEESLNESPSEKEGKCHSHSRGGPRRPRSLNESPSEKEGKYEIHDDRRRINSPSMKVPPKRKGNNKLVRRLFSREHPQ